MTDLVALLREAIDETEAWARAASQTYEYADEGSKVPEGGVHWRWVIGENWDEVTPDPMTMQFLEGPDGSWSANLATVEEWPSTSRIDDERTRTTMMRRVYANSIEEMDPAAAGHIARHDPASVLRRCAADRKILDLHREEGQACTTCHGPEEMQEYYDHEAEQETVEWVSEPAAFPCGTVAALAVYYEVEVAA